MYKRNRMIVTNPVVSRKDPTFNTTTYDWAPAGLNQKLVRISEKYDRLVVCMKLQFAGEFLKSPAMLLRSEDTGPSKVKIIEKYVTPITQTVIHIEIALTQSHTVLVSILSLANGYMLGKVK